MADDENRHSTRDCGDCHLCCKVFPIPETGKADFAPCPHLDPETGCRDYDARPQACREFACLWLLDPSLPEAWKPCEAGFVLHDPAPWALLASVDVDWPDAWRREPYHGQLQAWAREFAQGQHLVGVRTGARMRLLLRDREMELDV